MEKDTIEYSAEYYKAKTIEAVHLLIDRYENSNAEDIELGTTGSCPLCQLYLRKHGSCRGCFMAGDMPHSRYGCMEFSSMREMSATNKSFYIAPTNRNLIELRAAVQRRARFHRAAYSILLELPAEKFHPDTWTYFQEIKRNW